jgi:hypothetical protein
MNLGHVLYEMVRADFLERARRYSFLVTLAGALYLGYAVATQKVWIVVGNGYRGIYNSAWIGALMAVTCSVFLSLVGFYVVKGSVQRDTETRVGQILAATPMRKPFYTLAKTISNFVVLASMVAILMVAAVIMQVFYAEVHQVSLWKLVAPFLLITLPAMAMTAAIAVLFETVPLLRSGIGNVIYFFAWTGALAATIPTGAPDPAGLQVIIQSTRAVLWKIDTTHKDTFGLTIGGIEAVRKFLWNGVDWTAAIVLGRLMWCLVAVGFALLASVFFHRFDPAREFWRKKARLVPDSGNGGALRQADVRPATVQQVQLTPLSANRGTNRFVQLVLSELRLMLQGQRWWWYAGAAGTLIGQLVSPAAEVREGFLLVAWIWPILIWSQMGTREARFNTRSLIFSSPRALLRQLPALWTAGVVLALLTGGGVAMRLLVRGDHSGFLGWLGGALFIPSLALALGVWGGQSKVFEAMYTAWWYIGPLHHVPGLDFMGTTAASTNPMRYLLVSAALLASSYVGRRARLGYA